MSALVATPTHPLQSVRASRRIWVIVYAMALVVRVATALPQVQPGYMDAAYYYDIAANLAQGRGFSEDFAWNYLSRPTSLPQPSNAYWMPLTSVVIAPFLLLAADSYRAAQIPMILLSALLVPICFALSLRWFGRRDWAWSSAVLMLASAFYLPFWSALDSFALYGLIGTALLWLVCGLETAGYPIGFNNPKAGHAALARSGIVVWAVAAGACIALAHLTRADGFLLFAVFAAIAKRSKAFVTVLAVALGSYLVVMAPWIARNLLTFGAPLPGGSTAFLRTYNDLFAYDLTPTFDYWWGGGMERIAGNVTRALLLNSATLAGALHFVYLPMSLIALILERRRAMVRGAAIYLAVLLFVATAVFSLSGPRGTFLHSLTVVLPVLYVLAPRGLSASVAWIAERRRNWNAPRAEKIFGLAFLVMAIGLSASYYFANVFGGGDEPNWNERFVAYRQVNEFLKEAEPADAGPIICINPPAYYYFNRQASIALPTDDALALVHAARAFKAHYFILEADHPAYLDGLYTSSASDQRFALRAAFLDAAGAPVQLYQIVTL